ncbi:MAG: hypothetical protein HYV02_01425 [Deltaproteobacteria bacterium]|nr:hypothetical protein [Deltaproteobacteria bacterium]
MKAADIDMCEYLWGHIPKAPDSEHITYLDVDIELLWQLGFVDTTQFAMEAWQNAFAPFRTTQGTYILSKPDFMTLDHYRYQGELYAPFEPRLINEGQYTDEGFQELVDASIAPSCGWNHRTLQQQIDTLKKEIRQPGGLLTVDRTAKARIQQWLEEHPSPLRRLELLFATMLATELALNPDGPATPQQLARAEASTFSMLSNTVGAEKQRALKALEKAKLPASVGPDRPEDRGPRLKAIRRSRRGIRS